MERKNTSKIFRLKNHGGNKMKKSWKESKDKDKTCLCNNVVRGFSNSKSVKIFLSVLILMLSLAPALLKKLMANGKLQRARGTSIARQLNARPQRQPAKRLMGTFAIMAWLLIAGAFLTLGGNVVVRDGQLNVTDDFFVSTDVLFVDTTNSKVGIGTTSPSQRLEVAGNINATGTVYAENFSSDSPLRLQTAGTTRLYINDSNGYLGINTTSPAGTLDVQGKIKEYGNDLLPSGVILMWSGTIANIPTGWGLCNGSTYTAPGGAQVSTPDLRNRFIYGVNATEDPGATGGSSTHSHDMGGGLVHFADPTITLYHDDYSVPVEFGYGGDGYLWFEVSYAHLFKILMNAGDIVNKTVSPPRIASGETTDTAGTVPPYYKLAYIMKL